MITLTTSELMTAAQVGVRRNISSIIKGNRSTHGADQDKLYQIHVEGACGELAFCRFANLYWPAKVDTYRSEPDIDPNIEVKTRSRHDYELLVRKDDNPDSIFVLVTGIYGKYEVRGWMLGKDAMKDEYIQTHGGREAAFFVPQNKLLPWSSIK